MYSHSDVLKLTGATHSQLTWWSARRWLPSMKRLPKRGPGYRTIYTPDDVAAARAAVEAQQKYGASAPRAVLAAWPDTK